MRILFGLVYFDNLYQSKGITESFIYNCDISIESYSFHLTVDPGGHTMGKFWDTERQISQNNDQAIFRVSVSLHVYVCMYVCMYVCVLWLLIIHEYCTANI